MHDLCGDDLVFRVAGSPEWIDNEYNRLNQNAFKPRWWKDPPECTISVYHSEEEVTCSNRLIAHLDYCVGVGQLSVEHIRDKGFDVSNPDPTRHCSVSGFPQDVAALKKGWRDFAIKLALASSLVPNSDDR